MLDWLRKNKEWVFSGAGFFFLSGVFWFVRRVLTSSTPSTVQSPRAGRNSTVLNAGRDKIINIGPQHNNPEGQLREKRKQEARKQIETWREMVTEVHEQQMASLDGPVSATVLLELHPDFLSLEPYLSEGTWQILSGRTFPVPPDQSTMDGRLHAVLKDLARLEREWWRLGTTVHAPRP